MLRTLRPERSPSGRSVLGLSLSLLDCSAFRNPVALDLFFCDDDVAGRAVLTDPRGDDAAAALTELDLASGPAAAAAEPEPEPTGVGTEADRGAEVSS